MRSLFLEDIVHEMLLKEEAEESIFVCLACIDDTWLKKRPSKCVMEQTCASCGVPVTEALTSKVIVEGIKRHLPDHFAVDDDLYPGRGMTLSQIVGIAIKCNSESVCNAVAKGLVEPNADEGSFYFDGQDYCRKSSRFESVEDKRAWAEAEWARIATGLIHGRRFFNPIANGFFEKVISEVMRAGSEANADTSAVVNILPQNTRFYRARIASTHAQIQEFQKDPPGALGAPPKDRAANNRMSPAGVPLLYVAADADTGIAEVRPSIGDTVVVGEFIASRPMEFFDFTALTGLQHKELSWFEHGYRERTDRRLLLEYLHELIARPVRANDTDYVMTQALAEYIRYYADQRFDGISFRSVQRAGGINYVIFDKSTPEEMLSPNWLPKFSLEASKEPVSIFEVKQVQYQTSRCK
ncbi:RES family NAD+ phosphorylase [Pseudomonas viridiflava]|uniref:RES family NAD+ phosphorylase n=1 Tax=Pseudomonas viridiflava TaxID=33069 RepID=UPI000F0275C2|nr:RES family NAD+ phosphorylase [Pseudomonas viridiflava]MBV1810090.1 RES family NAD+ phosphorylase [Pseudomonas viridiflava]